uniref:Ig-like domain-containing protein n=1 Tax=Trichuris muris TaxID=70415 RepID=A0A5S6QN04_TRIMR
MGDLSTASRKIRYGRLMESKRLKHVFRASRGQTNLIFLILVTVVLSKVEGSSVAYLKKLLQEKEDSINSHAELYHLVEKPSLHISAAPKDIQIGQGTSVSLRCDAQGIPTPTISWKFNGNSILQGKRESERNLFELLMNGGEETVQSSNTAAQLYIPCATYEQDGNYECVAENGFATVSAKARVVVDKTLPAVAHSECVGRFLAEESERTPKIYMWTDFRFEVIGASVQLFCRASGNPEPKVSWYRADGRQIVSGGRFNILDNGDLLIRHGMWDDAGLYFCKATNNLGMSEVQTFYYPTAVRKQKENEVSEKK